MKTAPVFVYGTLTSHQVVRTLLGKNSASVLEFQPARLLGYSRHPVKNCVYPGMIPHPEKEVRGCLLENVSFHEMKLLDWFEGDEYERRLVQVSIERSPSLVEAHAYVWKPHLLHSLRLEEEWCYETFCNKNLNRYIQKTVGPCRKEMENLGMTSDQ